MAEILEMYHSMAGCPLSELQTVLQAINQHQALNTKERDKLGPLVSNISDCLQRADTRHRGLLTLQCLLQACGDNDDILAEKGSSWMTMCVAALKSPRDQALSYNIIKLLLEKCSSVHELDRTVINASLPDLAASLSKCTPHTNIHALRCLETLLSRYSKASGAHKSAIEKFLVKFLDSRNKREVMYAAKCAHLLQQVRGGGEQGVNHKMAWRSQLDLLIAACSSLLGELYEQTADTYGIGSIDYFTAADDATAQNSKPDPSSANVGPLHAALRDVTSPRAEDPEQEGEAGNPIIRKAIKLSVRLENLLVFIQAMLVDPFPVHKRLNCRSVLSLLIRCQAAGGGKPSPARMEPALHCAVADTLRALTFCLKGDILPYSSLMMRIALQTLEWSRGGNNSSGSKPFKSVRKSVYSVLTTLLLSVHTVRLPPQQGDQSFEDKVFQNMLDDIVPQRVTIQLTVKTNSGGPVKSMSKKARRKMTMAQLEASGLPAHSPYANSSNSGDSETLNTDLVVSALECMDALFIASGNFFKATTYQLVQDSLIRMLYEVNRRSAAVRRAVSHTLMLVQQYSATTNPSPVAHCLNLFSMAQHGSSLKMSAQAHSALHASLTSIRGAAPPLLIPKPVEQAAGPAESGRLSQQQRRLEKLLNKSQKRLTNGEVIEVGDSVDSASSQGEDSMTSEAEIESVNSKKRKRSRDKRIHKVVTPDVTATPAGKRARVSPNNSTTETQEIIDSSDAETEIAKKEINKTSETINLDEELSNDVVIMSEADILDTTTKDMEENDKDGSNFDDATQTIEDRSYTHKLKKQVSVSPDVDVGKDTDRNDEENNCLEVNFLKSARKIDVSNVLVGSHLDKSSNDCIEKNGEADEPAANPEVKDVSKDSGVPEKSGVSLEDMMNSFVDEVVEDLK